MANMYNETIEKLINLALADGELTEKEKQVLFKKAEAAGIDLDEFEMVLDTKLFEKQSAIEKESRANIPTSAPRSEKFGDVKKCPGCGAMAQSFQTKCPDCGHEFSNIGSNVSIGKLFDMLNACEAERANSPKGVFDAVFGQALRDVDPVTEKKRAIISGFPIPNTKEDILEFLSMAVPNAKKKGNLLTQDEPRNKAHNALVSTWQAKCEQIIMKAKFSMKDDSKTLNDIMLIGQELGIGGNGVGAKLSGLWNKLNK